MGDYGNGQGRGFDGEWELPRDDGYGGAPYGAGGDGSGAAAAPSTSTTRSTTTVPESSSPSRTATTTSRTTTSRTTSEETTTSSTRPSDGPDGPGGVQGDPSHDWDSGGWQDSGARCDDGDVFTYLLETEDYLVAQCMKVEESRSYYVGESKETGDVYENWSEREDDGWDVALNRGEDGTVEYRTHPGKGLVVSSGDEILVDQPVEAAVLNAG
ncbi:hypothetical protein [Corynebacterium sp. 335C]